MTRSKAVATTTTTIDILGDGPRGQALQIDPRAAQFIMERLTTMYANPIAATVREVISNALDATQFFPEADRKRVKVTVPTLMDPTFTVEDFGVGMTAEEATQAYGLYGASEKIENLDLIGAFGLGAKAPLAYTSAFFVDTTKNGVTSYFKVEKDGLKSELVHLESLPTDRPNGTIVRVPLAATTDITAFAQAAANYHFMLSDQVDVVKTGEAVGLCYPWDIDGFSHRTYLGTVSHELSEAQTIDLKIYLQANKPLASPHSLRDRPAMAFSLQGWLYADPHNLMTPYSHLLEVALEPGLVNFPSSRDTIVADSRVKALTESLQNKAEALLTAYFWNEAYPQLPDGIKRRALMELDSFILAGEVSHDKDAQRVSYKRCGASVSYDLLSLDEGFNPLYLGSSESEVLTVVQGRANHVGMHQSIDAGYVDEFYVDEFGEIDDFDDPFPPHPSLEARPVNLSLSGWTSNRDGGSRWLHGRDLTAEELKGLMEEAVDPHNVISQHMPAVDLILLDSQDEVIPVLEALGSLIEEHQLWDTVFLLPTHESGPAVARSSCALKGVALREFSVAEILDGTYVPPAADAMYRNMEPLSHDSRLRGYSEKNRIFEGSARLKLEAWNEKNLLTIFEAQDTLRTPYTKDSLKGALVLRVSRSAFSIFDLYNTLDRLGGESLVGRDLVLLQEDHMPAASLFGEELVVHPTEGGLYFPHATPAREYLEWALACLMGDDYLPYGIPKKTRAELEKLAPELLLESSWDSYCMSLPYDRHLETYRTFFPTYPAMKTETDLAAFLGSLKLALAMEDKFALLAFSAIWKSAGA